MISIIESEPLSRHTTFRTGGKADFFIEANTAEDIREAIIFSKEKKLPIFILGGGSNVLASDEGFRGVIVRPLTLGKKIKEESGDMVKVEVSSGEDWDAFVSWTVLGGLWGLENLSFIPGSVGASPIQNIGAYGREISDVIESVRVFNIETLKEEVLSKDQCNFSYRYSFFKEKEGEKYIVLSLVLSLSRKPNPILSYRGVSDYFVDREVSLPNIREAIISIRKKKLPSISEVGTAGSFFKNPIVDKKKFEELSVVWPSIPGVLGDRGVKLSAAWLIDNVAQMKGLREGDVGVWENQPLAIVNYGNTTSYNIISFAEKIKKKVFEKTKVELEREVIYFGN